MNDCDYILLKAQNDALRTYFLSLLKHIMGGDSDKVWLAKYLLWRFERENLSPSDCMPQLDAPAKDRIDRRRFQLQVLMDVAYIQGGLEGYDIARRISPDDRALAERVYSRSDGSEARMVDRINEFLDS